MVRTVPSLKVTTMVTGESGRDGHIAVDGAAPIAHAIIGAVDILDIEVDHAAGDG